MTDPDRQLSDLKLEKSCRSASYLINGKHIWVELATKAVNWT